MGRMKETYELEEQSDLRIMDMFNEGLKPTTIAAILNIPLTMVYEVIEQDFDFSNPDIVQYDEDEL
jgi:hypothetical protein